MNHLRPIGLLLACGVIAAAAGCDSTSVPDFVAPPGGGTGGSDTGWVAQSSGTLNNLNAVAFRDTLRNLHRDSPVNRLET